MSRKGLMLGCCAVMVLAGVYLLWRAGNKTILSYAVLLLCPLMHILMMRGHGHHHGEHQEGQKESQGGNDKRPACH